MAVNERQQTARHMNALKSQGHIERLRLKSPSPEVDSSNDPIPLTSTSQPATNRMLTEDALRALLPLLPCHQINLAIHPATLISMSTANPTSLHHTEGLAPSLLLVQSLIGVSMKARTQSQTQHLKNSLSATYLRQR